VAPIMGNQTTSSLGQSYIASILDSDPTITVVVIRILVKLVYPDSPFEPLDDESFIVV